MPTKLTILGCPPRSGDVPEHRFGGSSGSSWTWARIEPPDGQPWHACLQGGQTSYESAILLNTSPEAFIVARGKGYWLNLTERMAIHTTECDMIGAAIAVPGQHIVIIADHTTACALRVDKIVWQTPRISLNGIHLVSATANRITGSARGYGEAEDGWEPVELDAVSGEVLRSPLCKNRSLE